MEGSGAIALAIAICDGGDGYIAELCMDDN